MKKNPLEYAWVVERSDSQTCSPMYLRAENGQFGWTMHHDKALRFAREGDAALCYAAIRETRPSIYPDAVRICEHAWEAKII